MRCDRTGARYGRLTVIGKSSRPRVGEQTFYWDCRCDCGERRTVRGDSLTSGATKSCGCLNNETRAALGKTHITHGLARTPTHKAWCRMKERCLNPTNRAWRYYGGRGITICDRWVNDFAAFHADMGEMPAGLSLERVDNNLGYSPDNCVWADKLAQSRNRRNSIRVIVNGEMVPLKEYADREGLGYGGAMSRVVRGQVEAVRLREVA